ncbi:Sulfatase [Phytophthora palmivora]|uniref:Sulfatase n=1 Tax=Phytophthora palmivora TaxID=4796 RepID=A0A2P4XAZ2_9STRA|nr:Sulfatase [Phytophthora palmivora]
MSFLKHLDINAFPFKTPMLLMTAEGNLLEGFQGRAVPTSVYKTKQAPNGLVVFEASSGNCLGVKMNGRRTETNCDTPYDGAWQEWLLLKPINILPLGSTLEYLANESRHNPVARREMILTLYRAGICCEIILKLLYGLTMPLVDDVSTAPTKKERQEQLLGLVKSGESPEEACTS